MRIYIYLIFFFSYVFLYPLDVAGGDSTSILDAIRRCMDVSTHLCLTSGNRENSAVSWKEAFYLATLGGAKGKLIRQQLYISCNKMFLFIIIIFCSSFFR